MTKKKTQRQRDWETIGSFQISVWADKEGFRIDKTQIKQLKKRIEDMVAKNKQK